MSLNRSEYRFRLRAFMEVCKILGETRLTITEDRVELTTEDQRIVGLEEVAEFVDTTIEEYWENYS